IVDVDQSVLGQIVVDAVDIVADPNAESALLRRPERRGNARDVSDVARHGVMLRTRRAGRGPMDRGRPRLLVRRRLAAARGSGRGRDAHATSGRDARAPGIATWRNRL